VSRRATVSRRGGAVVLTLLPAEVQVLHWVFGDLGRMLAGESGNDAVNQRLFPRAYLDPTAEESEAQWQDMVHDELVEARLAALAGVVQSLDEAVDLPGRDAAREIALDPEQTERWMTVLNDARLASNLPPMGFLNPWIYSIGRKGVNDIVSGSAHGCDTEGFPAQKGWDPVTGFGTPVSTSIDGASF